MQTENNPHVVSHDEIDAFLKGSNPMERVIKVECGYKDTQAEIYYRDENGVKRSCKQDFKPFLWARQDACRKLFNGDREKVKLKLAEYSIECFGLRTCNDSGIVPERMANGYNVMFRAKVPMSMERFQQFFIDGGRPIYRNEDDPDSNCRDYQIISANEQFMMETGIRLFKGYEDYDSLLRLTYDLETTGLNPHEDYIDQIGIRTNKGYKKIISVEGENNNEKFQNETNAMNEFFSVVGEIDPDIITGHNVENFDWDFFDVRAIVRGTTMSKMTENVIGRPIYKKKKQKVLKLGGEVEYYFPTIMRGVNLTDSLHAVRRAMAQDSSMKSANLKYVCKYSKIKTPNRVYVPGKLIGTIWRDKNRRYAYNDKDGEWFKVTKQMMKKTYALEKDEDGKPLPDSPTALLFTHNPDNFTLTNNETGVVYDLITGRRVVERYLEDDLYEGDRVELQYNQPNFLIAKMLPVSFDKTATMGTAAIWKYIMLAWSYEHNLAVPELIDTYKFTGGLSRLLCVGYVDRIVKLDYNSLYPAIILSYAIKSDIDIVGVMNALLAYVLTKREYFKALKGEFGHKADDLSKQLEKKLIEYSKEIEDLIFKYESEKIKNDKLQLPFKIFGNSFFGSYGSGPIFPWSDLTCAEMTTCIGRQCLRLMISHFSGGLRYYYQGKRIQTPFGEEYSYRPIVGDSFTPDTPLFIKYDASGYIDIKPISELINEEKVEVDALGREYDYSEKTYSVLCRSGWVKPEYIYRHTTDKDIYRATESEKGMLVDVTEDHSLFDSDKKKIAPKDIKSDTQLEYYDDVVKGDNCSALSIDDAIRLAMETIDRVPVEILNSNKDVMTAYYYTFRHRNPSDYINTKTLQAGIAYIKKTAKV